MTGTEEGLVKGKSAEEKRKPERVFSGHRVKNFVTVIRVDGELPKEQIREDAKPLEELTFTSALPFLLCDPEIFQEYIAIGTLCWIRGRVLRVSNNFTIFRRRKDMAIYEGAGVALITPFKANGEVNYDKLEEIVEEQIAGGTDAIVACGTTGEASTMTHEEHLDVIKFVCEVTKKRIPVIAGTGSNCTETAIYLSQEAEKNGADGLLVVSPYYNKATQKGLIAHFSAVANSVKIPMLLYNITGRTGVTIQPATIAHLWKNVDNIVGVKEANGDFSATATLMNLTDGGIDLYSGNDDQIVPLLSLGGKGVISVLSNVAPAQAHEICAAYFAGDVKRSAKLQLDAIPLIHALFSEVNPIPVKAAMNLLGKETGPLRMPLTEMEPEHQEVLKKELQAYGLL